MGISHNCASATQWLLPYSFPSKQPGVQSKCNGVMAHKSEYNFNAKVYILRQHTPLHYPPPSELTVHRRIDNAMYLIKFTEYNIPIITIYAPNENQSLKLHYQM